jgi:hypothetical protein
LKNGRAQAKSTNQNQKLKPKPKQNHSAVGHNLETHARSARLDFQLGRVLLWVDSSPTPRFSAGKKRLLGGGPDDLFWFKGIKAQTATGLAHGLCLLSAAAGSLQAHMELCKTVWRIA